MNTKVEAYLDEIQKLRELLKKNPETLAKEDLDKYKGPAGVFGDDAISLSSARTVRTR